MKINELITRLSKYQEINGDVLLKEFKIVLPNGIYAYHLNSDKDKSKKMTTKEYLKKVEDSADKLS